MKKISLFLTLLFVSVTLCMGQHPADVVARTQLDSRFAPFYHGVASGDPLTDRVIIWTRVTPSDSGAVQGTWLMATDSALTNVVNNGTFSTSEAADYTVKVDVTGLQPGNWYYYQFEVDGRQSLTGRTYTAPTGDIDSLRFGIVSCSKYSAGYFNVYGRLAQRNDLHAVIHLGDYIYEDGSGSGDREHEPDFEITELVDYRMRHSQHKMDEDLRCLHQMYPMICVWDDHESANNSWKGGAEEHGSGEGDWTDRKAYSVQAYHEWMPIRPTDPTDPEKIYRTIRYGDLMDLILLDTRLVGRDEQVTGSGIDDPNRSLLGAEQLGWLSSEMKNSTARWKVIGQQVMMAPLEVPFIGPVNTDQWDGYRAERQRVYDSIATYNIDNVVVLTGDIHTFWANDLPGPGYDAGTGANSIGVEYVVSSVTSLNSVVNLGEPVIQLANPHMKYINLADHGYILLDLTKTRTQGDFYLADDIDNPNVYTETVGANWYVDHLSGHLQEANGISVASTDLTGIPQPSKNPPNLAIGREEAEEGIALLGIYPNPMQDEATVNFYQHKPGAVHMELLDGFGKKVAEQDWKMAGEGLRFERISVSGLAAGVYLLRLTHPSGQVSRKLLKR